MAQTGVQYADEETADRNSFQSYQNTNENTNLILSSAKTESTSQKFDYDENSSITELKLSDAIHAIGAHRMKQKQSSYQLVEVTEVSCFGEMGKKVTKTLAELLQFIDNEVTRINSTSQASQDSESTLRSIHTHDLRHLVHEIKNEEPVILIRKHAVLISFYPIRAIVLADKLLLITGSHSDTSKTDLIQEIAHDLQERSHDEHTNQNTTFYATLLNTILALHTAEFNHLKKQTDFALSKYNVVLTPITVDKQETLRQLKNLLSICLLKINSYRVLFGSFDGGNDEQKVLKWREFLSDDMVIVKLDLFFLESPVVVLLETHLMDYNTLHTLLEGIRSQIQFTEEMLFFRLDTQRNELLEGEIAIAVIMSVLGVVTFVTSAFGMNIYSGLENIDVGFFWTLLTFLMVFAFVGSYFAMIYFKRFGLFQRTNAFFIDNTKTKEL